MLHYDYDYDYVEMRALMMTKILAKSHPGTKTNNHRLRTKLVSIKNLVNSDTPSTAKTDKAPILYPLQ